MDKLYVLSLKSDLETDVIAVKRDFDETIRESVSHFTKNYPEKKPKGLLQVKINEIESDKYCLNKWTIELNTIFYEIKQMKVR